MSSNQPSPDPVSANDDQTPRKRRTPPKWLWITLGVFGLLIAIVRGTDLVPDHGIANVTTWVMVFLATIVLLVWFVFLSGHSRPVRLGALAACAAGVGLFFALMRLDRVSGELVPTFVYRYASKPDRLIEPATPEVPAGGQAARVDLGTTTQYDFPQFLGPNRDVSVESVRLARDWKAQPPRPIWRQEIGAGWSAFAVVNGHAVTMEQRGDLEMVTCYDVPTGRLEWAYSAPARYDSISGGAGPRATPTIDAGMVYAQGALGHLVCLDGATGQCRWEKNLLRQYAIAPEDESAAIAWGRSASPLVAGELVIVPAGGPAGGRKVSLVALDKRTGAVVWEGGDRQISYSSPLRATLGGVEQILIVNEDTVSGHDVRSGKPLWEHPWPGRSNRNASVSQAVPIEPNRVFLSKAYGQGAMLLELSPRGDGTFATRVVWQNSKVMKTKFANVTVKDGCVYGLSDGVLECIELETGRRIWKDGRYQHGQILRVHDLLLVLSEEGEVVLVEATPDRVNRVLGRFQAIEGMTWNNFSLYGPYLLVRNGREAACIQLPVEGR